MRICFYRSATKLLSLIENVQNALHIANNQKIRKIGLRRNDYKPDPCVHNWIYKDIGSTFF